MFGFVLRRIVAMLPVLLLVSILVFGLVLLIPGDPAASLAGENPSPERIAEVRTLLGLDQPIVTRYISWLGDLVQLDLGTSFRSSQTVWGAITARLPVTVSLAVTTLAFSVVVGVGAGVLAGIRPGGALDRAATVGASLGVAIPHFWLGSVLLLLFALQNRWLPTNGYVGITDSPVLWAKHLVLPSIALGAASAAEIARQTRASLASSMQQDFVRTARAKGLEPVSVIGKHALKNAAIPVVTVLGLQTSRLIGGTVVVEQVFGLPGIGQLAYQAVFTRDFPMIQGIVMVAAVIVVVVNLLVDLSYGLLNPKLRET